MFVSFPVTFSKPFKAEDNVDFSAGFVMSLFDKLRNYILGTLF